MLGTMQGRSRTHTAITLDPGIYASLRAISKVTDIPATRVIERGLREQIAALVSSLTPAQAAAFVALGGTPPDVAPSSSNP